MHKIVAIHQPNFFPWLGYFDKIRRADVFVFLDDVQYQKTGGVWSNRVKILVNGDEHWLTAPIDRSFHGTRLVNEISFSTQDNWRVKLLKTLQACYGRAAFYRETMDLIEPLITFSEDGVAEYNVNAVIKLVEALGLNRTRFVRSSMIPAVRASTERLIEIASFLRGTHYLCGGGADGYQQDDMFADAGIGLVYQDYMHPKYAQSNNNRFVPGLSIIDVLMHCGLDKLTAWFAHETGAMVIGTVE